METHIQKFCCSNALLINLIIKKKKKNLISASKILYYLSFSLQWAQYQSQPHIEGDKNTYKDFDQKIFLSPNWPKQYQSNSRYQTFFRYKVQTAKTSPL